jgi:protein-tyrosine phosphatase
MTRRMFRLSICAVLLFLASRPSALSTFEALGCEETRPGSYHLTFTAPDNATVTIFASSRPDRIDRNAPLAKVTHSPADVTVPVARGRVYFHLISSSGEKRVVAVRRLPLEGAANFRDLGGYPTMDGHHVKWGLVYRSNHLANLTQADYQYLNALGIKLICDLRTDGERKRFPTRWQGAAEPELMPVSVMKDTDVNLSPDTLRQMASAPPSQLSMTYDRMVTEIPEQYGRVFQRIAHGDLPSVTHCTAGKDRTGVYSAVLLTMLGVPRQLVVQDYMLTGEYMLNEAGLQRATDDWQKLTGSSEVPDPQTMRALYTMHAETITGVFETIARVYGSFDGFVHKGLRLNESDVQAIRRRLLEL